MERRSRNRIVIIIIIIIITITSEFNSSRLMFGDQITLCSQETP